ncbi:hypothetical protein, partial [Paenibacillus sp. OT2-17]|uniref:hypothetical protein n=1 Tax=Paenibacillus sp. OT2-17 TaxID=2691605 RepID=UPI001F3A091E
VKAEKLADEILFRMKIEQLHEKSREPLHDVEVPALRDFRANITLFMFGIKRFEIGFNRGTA